MAEYQRSTSVTGSIGEYYVAAYLSFHRFVVALPRAGVPTTDMFVSRETDSGQAISIQVKTCTKSFKNSKVDGPIFLWHGSQKLIDNVHPDLWYAFVWLRKWPSEGESPALFFIPSAFVAKQVQITKDLNEPLFFWMKQDEAPQYAEDAGVRLLSEALNSKTSAHD